MRPGIGVVASLMVLTLGPVALAQDGLPDSRLGIRHSPLTLLTRGDVQADLKLTREQVAEFSQFFGGVIDQGLAIHGRTDPQAIEVRDRINKASTAWLMERLSASQRERLMQLDIQWEGPSAILSRPILAESLKLTDTQAGAIGRAIARRNTRRGNGPVVPSDEAELAAETLSILNDPQKLRWKAALGSPGPFHLASSEAPVRR